MPDPADIERRKARRREYRTSHRGARRREDRLRRERERAARPRFTCARCGREFEADDAREGGARGRLKRFSLAVMIGGRAWCERCAEARFPRRRNLDCPLGAETVELRHQTPVRRTGDS